MPFTIKGLCSALTICGNSSVHDGNPYAMLRYVPNESLSFLQDVRHVTWKDCSDHTLFFQKADSQICDRTYGRTRYSCQIKSIHRAHNSDERLLEKLVNAHLVSFLENIHYCLRRSHLPRDALL